jgi:hypothetical protein
MKDQMESLGQGTIPVCAILFRLNFRHRRRSLALTKKALTLELRKGRAQANEILVIMNETYAAESFFRSLRSEWYPQRTFTEDGIRRSVGECPDFVEGWARVNNFTPPQAANGDSLFHIQRSSQI